MPFRLILNADDFGLTQGINRAIVELHQAGALTSATLMATGAAFDNAVTLARALPLLGVGCHIVLVDGTPASDLSLIPTLLDPGNRSFRPSLRSFVRDLLFGRIDEGQIALEAEAQIRRVQHAGIHVTHVDTHKHTHLFPAVARPVLLAARRCGIHAIRTPFEPAWSAPWSRHHAPLMRHLQLSLLRRLESSFQRLLPSGVATTCGTLGIAATGRLDASSLRSILSAAASHPDGDVYELLCHPGYNDSDLHHIRTRLRSSREIELDALLREVPRLLALPDAPRLIHYGDLSTELDSGAQSRTRTAATTATATDRPPPPAESH